MINKLWIMLIFLGISYSIISGRSEELSKFIIRFPVSTLDVLIPISLSVIFWSGMIKVASDSNLISKISGYFKFIMVKIFPEIPKNNKAIDYISANFIANVLGLGSVATPLGLKAFGEMQKLNKKKTPSKSMITFLLINTSGLTIIPTTILALRDNYNAKVNTELITYIFLATFITTISALLVNRVFNR